MDLNAFLSTLRDQLGPEWVNTSEATAYRYGQHTLPGPDVPPTAVVYPGSVKEVQAVVNAANRYRVPLHPISMGNNMSLGTRAAAKPNQVIVDLGRRMNRILEVDERLGYCVIEPGVTYQMLHDELARRGDTLMIDCTSGPPQGSVLGNAMDRGAGYTPYADHFGSICGMEIVLGNGELLHTGDYLGDHRMWNVSRYTFGLALDGLLVQSNLGLVTRAGLWLMPRPPAMKAFHLTFPDDDDLGTLIDLARPLKLSGAVPSLFRISNDLWLIGEEEQHPEYASTGGRASLSDAGRKALQQRHGLGAWTASAAIYGGSEQQVDEAIGRVIEPFLKTGRATFIPHAQSERYPGLGVAASVFGGHPSANELRQLGWRPGGGVSCFTPGAPMVGEQANELQQLARSILTDHGLEYLSMWVCAARFARGLHNIVFNLRDPDEAERADLAYLALSNAFHERGYSVGRAPIRYHPHHATRRSPVVTRLGDGIKTLFDPQGVISPGRYGLPSTAERSDLSTR
ncbi:MAG: FAD-binding oxidoreductase [Pigmentiphaga sp.]|nr:FAD-binding oxidoreductase [Pigmentiphaga sp.]